MSAAAPVNILMVEDNPGDARLVQEFLTEGFTAVFALTHCSRLKEALAFLGAKENRCEVILLDLSLPDSNGLGTFLAIHDQAPEVPIVILSGFNDTTLASQAVQKGAQDYIPKDSLDGDQLARTIRYAIERKQWQDTSRHRDERIKRLEKMEAIGRLSGGIAHNFNNILTAIIGNCELLRPRVVGDPKALRHAEAIQWAAQRASMLTKELLAFASRQHMRQQLIEINSVIRDLEPLLRGVISKDISFDFSLGADLRAVLTDPAQLEQVVMNLVLNARDALPAGGVISIRTQAEILAEPRESVPDAVPPGSYITLTVQDTGMGIEPHVLPRIFEPFFSTKENDRSTGLGLSTVYGIVQQNSGHICVESSPNAGTTFTVFLPSQDAGLVPSTTRASLPSRGNETILLVDDEAHISSILAEVLGEHGYNVLTATTGHQALGMLLAQGERIDLVITDVKMPGIGGLDLARRIHAARPGLKVVLISGHVEEHTLSESERGFITAFVAKPFTSEALTQAIRGALDTQSAPTGPG